MDTICPVIFYFFCYLDRSVYIYLFPLSLTSCCWGWTLYIQSFFISSATRIAVCILIYFPFPWLLAVLAGHYISSHFLFPLLFGSQWVYLYISPFHSFLLSGWTLYTKSFSIFFATWFTVSTYLFLLSFPSCSYWWTLYLQSISISSATRITLCLLIHFPFPRLLAVMDGHYMSSYFLYPQLLRS